MCYFILDSNSYTSLGDFAASDKEFAENLQIKFFTPEMFFSQRPVIQRRFLFPRRLSGTRQRNGVNGVFSRDLSDERAYGSLEMILFVGSPCSGKTTFYRTHFSRYEHVNQDRLKSREKCLRTVNECLGSGRSCVIDNTNPSRRIRKMYIDRAQSYSASVRCYVFQISKSLARNVNAFRAKTSTRQRLPEAAFINYEQSYEPPSFDEGFVGLDVVDNSQQITNAMNSASR